MSPWRIGEIFFLALAGACRRVYLPKPGRLTIRSVEQLPMALGFRYTVALPALDPVDIDVAERDLSITIDGATTTVTGDHAATELKFDALAGVHVVVTLTDVDGSGNRSEASEPLEFDATDTVPPHRPGALSVSNIEQIDIPSVPPEPGPTP